MTPSRFLLALGCSALTAATPAALLDKPAWFTGPAAIQTYAEGTYFHLATRTSLKALPAAMEQLVPQLHRALLAAGRPAPGPLQVVYHGVSPDLERELEVEVGVLVPQGTAPAGGCQVRVLAPFTCATTVYTGGLADVGKAYAMLYPALLAGGRKPLEESRQMVLFWENGTSTNNVMLIQVGVK